MFLIDKAIAPLQNVIVELQSHSFKFSKRPKHNRASKVVGEVKKVASRGPLNVSTVNLAAIVALTPEGCHDFLRRLDGEVWKSPCSFAFPQHEKELPNLEIQPSKYLET